MTEPNHPSRRKAKQSRVRAALYARHSTRHWAHENTEARRDRDRGRWLHRLAKECRCCSCCQPVPCDSLCQGASCERQACDYDEPDYSDDEPW